MSSKRALERIERDVDEDLTMAGSSRPPGPIAEANAALPFDPADVAAYQVRLRSLQHAVVTMEEWEDDLGYA